jgi:hypothetical protein
MDELQRVRETSRFERIARRDEVRGAQAETLHSRRRECPLAEPFRARRTRTPIIGSTPTSFETARI